MTYPTHPDANRRFAEGYLHQLSMYPDGAALILRVADRIRASSMNTAASAQPTEVPQNHEQTKPQTSTTTSDGWNF